MAENLNFKGIIVAFIVIIVGILLVGEVADAVHDNTTLSSETNESVEINSSRYPTTSDINETLYLSRFALDNNFTTITGVIMGNSTVLTENTDWNQTDDYLWMMNTTKVILANGDDDGNLTLVTYSYEPENYIVGSSIARTLISLIPLFFIIGILGFLIRDSGIVQNLLDKFRG